MKKFFELHRPYRFDPTDLTALIYVVCVIFAFCGIEIGRAHV